MILSNNVNTSIEVVLAGAITTNQLKCVATWVDTPSASFASGQTATSTNNTTAVTLVPAITDTYRREVTYISVLNTDTANATVTIQLNINGSATQIVKLTLATGSHLVYTQGSGWQIFTSGGAAPATGAGSYLEIANNLSDVASAATAFSNIKQAASETSTGVAEIATQTETNTGTDDARIVTPLKFQTRLAAYAQPLDTDLTDISGLSPSNDDVLQRKSGSWKNRTIAQLYTDLQPSVKDDVYLTIPFIPVNFSPADATTYYFGNSVIGTLATNVVCRLGYDVTVIGAIINATNNTTAGTAETGTMNLHNVTDATSSLISNTVRTDASSTVIRSQTATGLSINVDAADDICMEFVAPTWVTNPVSLIFRVILICKRR